MESQSRQKFANVNDVSNDRIMDERMGLYLYMTMSFYVTVLSSLHCTANCMRQKTADDITSPDVHHYACSRYLGPKLTTRTDQKPVWASRARACDNNVLVGAPLPVCGLSDWSHYAPRPARVAAPSLLPPARRARPGSWRDTCRPVCLSVGRADHGLDTARPPSWTPAYTPVISARPGAPPIRGWGMISN